MSVRRSGEIASRRLNDTVELCDTTTAFDGHVEKVTLISIGEFPAEIVPMSGGRFAYYQSVGYNHPMTITMRDPEIEFKTIRHNDRDLVVKNRITDPNNSNYIIITADYKSGQV